jgi:hypothetical protein
LRIICLLRHITEEKKRREDEEEDVSSYWRDLRKREDAVNCKRRHLIALSGEMA